MAREIFKELPEGEKKSLSYFNCDRELLYVITVDMFKTYRRYDFVDGKYVRVGEAPNPIILQNLGPGPVPEEPEPKPEPEPPKPKTRKKKSE